MSATPLLTIGLLGGIASGKSLVAARLASHGAVWLDADKAGHAVLTESEVKSALRQRFGDDVFGTDGEVVRANVAKIVFAPTPQGRSALADLEAITHPRIGQRLEEQIAAHRQAGATAAILDAPVMLKADWHRLCDHLVFVDCPREIREARAKQRGWTAEEFAAREASQESIAEKRAAATHTINNSGSRDETFAQVDAFWQSLNLGE